MDIGHASRLPSQPQLDPSQQLGSVDLSSSFLSAADDVIGSSSVFWISAALPQSLQHPMVMVRGQVERVDHVGDNEDWETYAGSVLPYKSGMRWVSNAAG